MSEGEWVSAKEAAERLQGYSDDPREFLLRLAQKGIVKTRSLSVSWDDERSHCLQFQDRKSGELKSQFWQAIAEKGWQDWTLGTFGFNEDAPAEVFGIGETLHWSAIGVEFDWLQVLQQVGPVSKPIPSMQGTLPQHAKPNDHFYAAAAHQAAEMVRAQHIKPGTAFNEIAKNYPRKANTTQASAVRAMRQTYVLMYDDKGNPHPK